MTDDLTPEPLPTQEERARALAAEALAILEAPPHKASPGQLSLVDEP